MPAVAPASTSGCAAPAAAVYLDVRGNVRPCCKSEFVLGNVSQMSFREIWRGAEARRLRAAVDAGDLSLGCGYCRWPVEQGTPELAHARYFDHLGRTGEDLAWPERIEFAMSNRCNLQCVMCSGEYSSAIRAQREHLPPLPSVYPDSFFEEMAEVVPTLREAHFAGGEPFLSRSNDRVWDLLLALDEGPACSMNTNGTIWNDRVETVIEGLDMEVWISIDGISAAVSQAVRVGVDHDALLRNLDRFVASGRRRGRSTGVAFCLMSTNWQEFGAVLRLAEDRGIGVSVNVVHDPAPLSLHRMPRAALAEVVAELERADPAMQSALTLNLDVWDAELRRLRANLESASGVDGGTRLAPVVTGRFNPVREPQGEGAVDLQVATDRIEEWAGRSGVTRLVVADEVLQAVIDPDGAIGVDLGHLVGEPLDAVMQVLIASLGSPGSPVFVERQDDWDETIVAFRSAEALTEVRTVIASQRSPDGSLAGAVVIAAARVGEPTGS